MYLPWEKYSHSEEFVSRIAELYGPGEARLEQQRSRYAELIERWHRRFGTPGEGLMFFSAPGRTEIGGNHTDHNNGRVLAAAVNLDTVAAVRAREDMTIIVDSEGYPAIEIDCSDTSVHPEETGTTAALIRGTAGAMKELGYAVGGFEAVLTSSVLSGSGLSSSAAFEVLICAILDGLYNGFVIDPQLRAVIAQKVENIWFGKPCGLMDQMACSVGGLVTIDFEKPEARVRALSFDFEAVGYALCIVNTGGSHDDLTEDYAAIRREMESVAAQFGRRVLRELPEEEFNRRCCALRGVVGDRALLRAMHYYDENKRVDNQVEALEKGDLHRFFDEVNASGNSSWKLLQNVHTNSPKEAMAFGIELTRRFLNGRGATRVHGGGFAGTIQAYVPLAVLERYRELMEAAYGHGSCTVVNIRPEGAVMMNLDKA